MKDQLNTRKNLTKFSKLSARLAEAELVLISLKEYKKKISEVIKLPPNSINDITEDINIMKGKIDGLKQEHEKELKELKEFIDSIEDTTVQSYMKLHYIRGLSWEEVAKLTKAKSAGVVMEYVQRSLNAQKIKNKGNKPLFSRKALHELAAISANLSKKEQILELLCNYLDSDSEQLDITSSDIKKLENEIQQLILKREEKLNKVKEFVLSINDPLLQIYMKLHYMRGFTWDEVAKLTKSTSGNAVRTKVMRYLDLHSKATG